MSKIVTSAIVPYSCEQMFALVNDIEHYPEFMSGCEGASVLNKGDNWVEARLDLARAGFKQSFTTHNTLTPPHNMHLKLVSGPFKSFSGDWGFEALNETACKVTFSLAFEFKNKLIGFAAGKVLKQIAADQVQSVRERADTVYAS